MKNFIIEINEIFKLNECSIQFIDWFMKQFIQKVYLTKAIQDNVNKKQLLIVLSFLGAQSFLVRKRVPSCIKKHLPYCTLRIAF